MLFLSSKSIQEKIESIGGKQYLQLLSNILSDSYNHPSIISSLTQNLSFKGTGHTLLISIDLMIFEVANSVALAASLVSKAALSRAKLFKPLANTFSNANSACLFEISQDPADFVSLNVKDLPLIVSCSTFGDKILGSPNLKETNSSDSTFVGVFSPNGQMVRLIMTKGKVKEVKLLISVKNVFFHHQGCLRVGG